MNTNAARFNVDPTSWGPHLWATMHTLALKADADNELEPFLEFTNSLLFLLPCDACRSDYSKYLNNYGPNLGQCFSWTVNLHNHVNEKLKKPIMGLEAAREIWTSDRCSFNCSGDHRLLQGPDGSNSNVGPIIFLLVAMCLLSVVYYFYKKRPKNDSKGASV